MVTETPRRSTAASVTVTVMGMVFVAALGWLVHTAIGRIPPFMGHGQPSPPENTTLTWIACAAAVLAPAIGVAVALSGKLRRSKAVDTMAVLLAIGVIAAVFVFPRSHTTRPGPLPADRHCQEHSGGDNRCPGG